jgi:hypothetical protein
MATTTLGATLNTPVSEPRPAIAGRICWSSTRVLWTRPYSRKMSAGDYVTIPFSPRKIVAHPNTLMRRASRVDPEHLHVFETGCS